MSLEGPVNILLVDDQPAKLLGYEVILRDLGENLIAAGSASEALACLLKNDVAVILMDVCMPELDGFELVKMLREHPRFEKIAVIFISAIQMSELDLVRGYETGAVDYLPVPVVPEILRAKVRIFVDLHRKTRALEHFNRELEERVATRTAELTASLAQLRESEERMRLASEAAEFGTYDYNVPLDRFHYSDNLKSMLGVAADGDLTLNAFLDLIHPEDRETVQQWMLALCEGRTERHEQEFRAVAPDGSVRWLLNRCGIFHSTDPDGRQDDRLMGTILDITDRKQAEVRQRLLMAELDHRVKNVLANVSAIARLSKSRALSVQDFVDALDGRIQAMSQAHSLLQRGNWDGADLADLVDALLSPFRSAGHGNIQIEGDPLRLGPKAAQSLALVLHELATNAVKYGALSVPGGAIRISWQRMANGGSGRVKLAWRETGGPAVREPDHMGFGMTVLRAAAAEFGATLDCDFREEGLICTLEGALEQRGVKLHAAGQKAPGKVAVAARPEAIGEALPMTGRRILIIEDEPLVAMQLQIELEREGLCVVGPVGSLAKGLEAVLNEDVDAALVDVSLGQDLSVPIADQLLMRRIPFAFTTGYTDMALLPTHLQTIARINKPYAADEVQRLLANLLTPRAAE
ncbi:MULTISPECIES: response regulator [Rhodomicrobium]|uniref:response regulator n=1 Tax=Rhodomicrobium TaxID=1068 RepID=UPI000B4AC3B8|nr:MULTISPECIES: response regulator [Rhodomicrobium]